MIKTAFFPTWSRPVLLMFILFFSGITYGENGPQSIFDKMQYKEVIDLTMEADFTALKANRRSDDSYDARITFKDETGQKLNWGLKIKVRGAFRRIHCSEMPPLKLNFKKSELRTAGLAEYDDIKLVPYCMGTEEVAKNALLREYLTYRMFNLVSDYSFRVQLLRITYKDKSTGLKTQQWAFLVEDAAQMRDRLGAEKVDEKNVFNLPVDQFENEYVKTVAVFQYMIGNADWSLSSGKNLKYLKKDGKIITVPYDFDYTSLVNAPYFAPDADFGLTDKTQRVFLGFPEYVANVQGATEVMRNKRPAIEQLIRDFKLLSQASRRDMLAYLASYFDSPAISKVSEKMTVKMVSDRQLQD